MLSQIIKIGNSKGIRIPKELLQQSCLRDKIEIISTPEGLLVKPANNPREGWEANFAKVKNIDISFINEQHLTSFDEEEWEW